MKKHRILFLAANPIGLTERRLDEEARQIEEEIRRTKERDQFEFISRLAARPMDLLRALRDVRPSIVHFSGHSGADGIYLLGESGQPAKVTGDALHATIGAAGQSVQIVVLNVCAVMEVGKALCDVVPVCVGTLASASDDAMHAFSIGFYGALASGEPVARACLHGEAAMRLTVIGDHARPCLYHRGDVDPETFVLAGDPAGAVPATSAEAAPPASAMAMTPRRAASPATGGVRDAAGTDLIAPLVLLQLSDLHFGPHGRFAGIDLDRLAAECRQALDEARGDLGWREAVGAVLVTGDIAEGARPPEYAGAATFFTALAGQLALSPHRFVFVPGNHDVSWNKCREVEGQFDDGAFPASELRERLDAVKLAHFDTFVREFYGGDRHEIDDDSVAPLRCGAVLHDFPDLGLSVAALNSCERESHRKADHIGALGAEQARSVLDHWRDAPDARIRIAAVHHNPASMASAAIEQWLAFLRTAESTASLTPELIERIATNFVGFEGRDELVGMASDACVSILFHGHHHASAQHQSWAWQGRDRGGPGGTRILSAGSWGLAPEPGKLPKDQPVVMQMVRIDPAAAQLHAVLLTWA